MLAAQRALTTPGWIKSDIGRKARALPSLDLRFAENKSLVDATTGANLVTFTRASSGTYVDSQGVIRTASNDVPRFDHNPITGESLGLLVEEQRTNLLLRSEEFTSNTWTLFGSASRTADVTTAPNGTLTADSVTLPVAAGIYQSVNASAGVTYTFSIWIRSDSAQSLRVVINSNLGDPTVVAVSVTTAWQRFSVVKTMATGTTSLSAQLDTGAGGTFYLWGAQLEAAAFPTSYIPTTTSAATRSADVASITTLGANVRSLFSQFRSPASGTRPIVSLDDNSANNRIELFTSGTDPKLLITSGGAAQADIDAGSVTANTTTRLAARFSTDNFAASVSGTASITDTSGTLPAADRVRIGRDQAGNYLNGTIARVTAWDAALPMLAPVSG